MKIAGVYIIRNTITGQVYVGSSANITLRWRQHRAGLRHAHHRRERLTHAWKQYGEDAFEFRIVEVVSEPTATSLASREQEWLTSLQAANPIHGYNSAPTAGSNLGRKVSAQTRIRMSAGAIGKVMSAEARAAMSAAKKGKPVGAALRANHVKGKPLTPEHRQRITEGMKRGWQAGKWSHTHTSETKAKISAAKAGVPNLKTRGVPKPAHVGAAVAESNRQRAKYKTEDEKREARRAAKARYKARIKADTAQGVLS